VKVAGTGLDPNLNNNKAEVTTISSFSTVVNPNLDSTLAYTDSVLGHHFQVWLPPGAVTDTIALRYTLATTPVVTSGLHFVGHAFHLDAYSGNTSLENFTFQRAVTVTLTYLDADVSDLNENELQLYYWDVATSTWAPAACGDYIRHPAENWLSVPICHLTEFGLFSPEEQSSGNNKLFLPLIFR
jgi:hypothetical protein